MCLAVQLVNPLYTKLLHCIIYTLLEVRLPKLFPVFLVSCFALPTLFLSLSFFPLIFCPGPEALWRTYTFREYCDAQEKALEEVEVEVLEVMWI